MMSTLKEIQQTLKEYSTPQGKAAFDHFVPGAQKVYGVRLPVINEIVKHCKENLFDLAEQLWKAGAFEEQQIAAKLIGKAAKKNPARALNLIEAFSSGITDWAVCDALGMQAPKKINKSHHKEIFALANKLIHSKNFWQRRLALVLSEWYTRDKSFHSQIKQLIAVVKEDDEYYVKKAIAWINRNFHKRR